MGAVDAGPKTALEKGVVAQGHPAAGKFPVTYESERLSQPIPRAGAPRKNGRRHLGTRRLISLFPR